MSLIKRNNSEFWQVDIRIDGRRIRRSTGTKVKREAEEFETKLRSEIYRQVKLGEKPRKTWENAVIRYSNSAKHKASWCEDQRHLRQLHAFLSNKFLDEISSDLIEDIIAKRESDGVKPATINRLMATLGTILRRANKQWQWLDQVPHIRRLPENNRRLRWLTPDEANRLIEACAEHLRDIVVFALFTGLRKSNVLGLKWSEVDLDVGRIWIPADAHKNRQAHKVDLCPRALNVLQTRANNKENSEYVFTYEGNPIKDVKRSFKATVRAASLEDVTFHTLRHTYASWHAQSGTPLLALQHLGGWKTTAMAQRYAHLSDDGLRVYQNQMQQWTQIGHISNENKKSHNVH